MAQDLDAMARQMGFKNAAQWQAWLAARKQTQNASTSQTRPTPKPAPQQPQSQGVVADFINNVMGWHPLWGVDNRLKQALGGDKKNQK